MKKVNSMKSVDKRYKTITPYRKLRIVTDLVMSVVDDIRVLIWSMLVCVFIALILQAGNASSLRYLSVSVFILTSLIMYAAIGFYACWLFRLKNYGLKKGQIMYIIDSQTGKIKEEKMQKVFYPLDSFHNTCFEVNGDDGIEIVNGWNLYFTREEAELVLKDY